MRFPTLLAAACVFGLAGQAAVAGSSRTAADRKAVAEITAIEVDMAKAQDADRVARAWADNVTWYEIGPVEIHGRAGALKLFRQQFAPLGEIRTRILRLEVNASGNVGYAYSTQRFISDVKGGPTLNFVFRETDVFEKQSGAWKLVHQHISVPADLGSGKAIVSSDDPLDGPSSVKPKP